MVACTTLGNGPHPCKHVVCTKITHDLWLQPTQSLIWPERAPSTNPCALRALDSPRRGGLSIPPNSSSQSPSRTINPSRILCSRHRNYPWCTPYTTITSHSSRYHQRIRSRARNISRTPHITTTHSRFTAPVACQTKYLMGMPHG